MIYFAFPALIFTALTASHGGLNMMIQYLGHNITAIGIIVGHLMVDTFLLHFSDFCPDVKVLKTLKGFFMEKV